MLHSPAAERNAGPILQVLGRTLPRAGVVLEIGSGSGQHVVHFAQALPALRWQPSDPDSQARASIAQRVAAAGLRNVEAPLAIDARARPWPLAAADAVLAVNVVHISPWGATQALIEEAARLLPAGGPLVLYGPYRRDGAHTAPSNAAFDADLRARDPSWGVRDLEAVQGLAQQAGLALDAVVTMPANNLVVVFRRAGDG